MNLSAQPSLRVLIVSRQPVARAGMAAVLRPFRSRVKVVGEVGGVDTAPEEAARSQAQIVLFDTRLDAPGGLDQVANLVTALGESRVVVLARRDEARFTWSTLQRGAAGFLLDTITGSDLVEALDEVNRGAIAVDPTLAGGTQLAPDEALSPRWPGAHLGLTETESRILELLAMGTVRRHQRPTGYEQDGGQGAYPVGLSTAAGPGPLGCAGPPGPRRAVLLTEGLGRGSPPGRHK
jgi:DNA-binding NarL/FixJ family response regulator